MDERTRVHPDVNLDIDYALIHEVLGERDQAIALMHSAVDRRLGSMIFLHAFPAWKDARSDPQFMELLERIGHPEAVTV
jgi:hypothetical protein